jgi:hypothetical protein
MIKIAICGKANSGKNALAKLLIKQISYDSSYQVAFADPIKKIAKIMFPHIPKKHLFGSSSFRKELIEGAIKNNQPLSVRQLLIDIGSAAREYDNEIWIKAFDQKLKEIDSYNVRKCLFIVPDLRFKNELDYLKNKDFLLIRLYRNDSPVINHLSETQDQILDKDFDYIIHNNGTLTDLKSEANNIVAKIKLAL